MDHMDSPRQMIEQWDTKIKTDKYLSNLFFNLESMLNSA